MHSQCQQLEPSRVQAFPLQTKCCNAKGFEGRFAHTCHKVRTDRRARTYRPLRLHSAKPPFKTRMLRTPKHTASYAAMSDLHASLSLASDSQGCKGLILNKLPTQARTCCDTKADLSSAELESGSCTGSSRRGCGSHMSSQPRWLLSSMSARLAVPGVAATRALLQAQAKDTRHTSGPGACSAFSISLATHLLLTQLAACYLSKSHLLCMPDSLLDTGSREPPRLQTRMAP